MRRSVKLAAVGLAALAVGFTGLALADHTGAGRFDLMIQTDEDGNKAEDTDVSLHYLRALSTPTLDAPAGWVDGDRWQYKCGYAFLEYRGHIVGRVTAVRMVPPDRSNYILVNDKFMHEGIRHYATGALDQNPEPEQMEPGTSCRLEGTEPYEPLVGDGEFPVVTFQHGPHAIEVRDFSDGDDVSRLGSTEFKLLSADENRVTIVAFRNRLPIGAIYYDRMADYVIPGTSDPVTLRVDCGLECAPPMPSPTPSPSPSPEPTPTEPSPSPPGPLLGDINDDGRVDIEDLRILVDNWTG